MGEGEMRLSYNGTGGELMGLSIGNAILTVLTVGIYSFWARTKVRQFHYGHTDLGGDRFAYHGTGQELLRGYFKVTGIIIVLAMALGVASVLSGGQKADPMVQFAITFGFYAALFLLSILAINGARRYRLSRSSWRGIRFSYHGNAREFTTFMLRGTALSIVTLGFYAPFFQNQRRAFLVNHARFGSESFTYDGPTDPLVKEWMKALLLTIPTLGLVWIWYSAFQHRHFWAHTRIAGARFESTITAEDLVGLTVTNVLLGVLTLGIAAPWLVVRTQRLWFSRLALMGTVDWTAIQQRAQDASTTGEALADNLDVDVGIEL